MTLPTWTILIPTLGQRDKLFRRLLDRLLPQTEAFGGAVKVAAFFNEGLPPLPEVRQAMVNAVGADYLSFIDDDDMVPEYHVAEVMKALESHPDYVGWQTHYFSGGKDHGLVDHSLRHGGWFEILNPYGLYRDISHINPMRADAAKAADFRVASSGQVEDRPWADQIRQSGMLKTEVYIEKPMYDYLWDRRVTAWRKPSRIRKGLRRPQIDHPNFVWYELDHDNCMVEDRGQRVPEPGARNRGDDLGLGIDLQAGRVPGRRRLDGLQPEGHLGQRGAGGRRGSQARSGVRPERPVTLQPGDRLAVIVPTRGRPDNIPKIVAAWDETQAWDRADLVLAVDADDPKRSEYYEALGIRPDGPLGSQMTVTEWPTWQPMVPKLDATARLIADRGRHFAVAFAGDDHLPRTPGWAGAYLAALRELGTGMVYGDDGYQGAKLSTEWAVTADAVRALGKMVPAPVDHLYCDNAMMDLFGGAGALRHLPEVRIEHMHPAAGKAKSDEQYDRVNGREQYRGDRRKYEIWKTTQGPSRLSSQIEIIRGLRGDRPEEHRTPKRAERVKPMRGSDPRRVQRSGPSVLNAAPRSQFPFPREFREIRGATPDEIAFALADFAKAVPADQEIVELGVFQARTAVIMAWGASLGNGAHVTAIDPWELTGNVYDPPFTDANTRGMAEHNVRSIGYGDRVSLVHDFSLEVARDYAHECGMGPVRQVGLLFVDGDHTKEGARRDIEAWAPHLAPGAVIAVDDYGHPDWPGVAQAVDELVDEGFLAPIELFHDRLAVTKLAEPKRITAITSEGVEPEPVVERTDSADGTVITVNGDVAYAALPDELLDLNNIEIPDAPQETLGSVRKRARALGLKPVGGIDDVLKQIADHEAKR